MAVDTAVLYPAGHSGRGTRRRGQGEAGMSQLLSHVDGVSEHPTLWGSASGAQGGCAGRWHRVSVSKSSSPAYPAVQAQCWTGPWCCCHGPQLCRGSERLKTQDALQSIPCASGREDPALRDVQAQPRRNPW